MIITNPDGARVKINGVLAGYTTFNNRLSADTYSITLEKDGYEPVSLQHKLNSDTTLATIYLTLQFGNLKIAVKDEQGAARSNVEVYAISGEGKTIFLGKTPKPIEKILPVDKYIIRVRPPKFSIVSSDTIVFIHKNKTSSLPIIVREKR
jgi:hypothetical protein